MSFGFACPQCREWNTVGEEFRGRRGVCAFCGAHVIVPQGAGVATFVGMTSDMPQRKSGTPWIIILAVVCGVMIMCGGILVALLLPAVQAAREAGRRASCMNKIKMISLAMENYASTNINCFPPASGGAEGHEMSWRVAILPYIERNDLYRQYRPNEPWNSPANLALVKRMPRDFRCPSDTDAGDGETSYVMITGKNTIGGVAGSRGTGLSEITDGTANTILVAEVHGLKIPWTEPRDITLDELQQRLKSGGGRIGHVSGFNVAFADGAVRHLSYTIDPETLRRLAIINDGQPVDVEKF